jgi:hypothetical protein
MYAAFRWVECGGHTRRHWPARNYRPLPQAWAAAGGLRVQSGAVTYDLLHASVAEIHARLISTDCSTG